MIKYEGLFFDKEVANFIRSKEEIKRKKTSEILHCTFKYMPISDELFNDIVGKSFEVKLIGYGYNDKNIGFEIELPNELNKYYLNKATPHITTSYSEDSEGFNTKNLNFKKIEKKYIVTGKFGFYIQDENNQEYISFDKYTY